MLGPLPARRHATSPVLHQAFKPAVLVPSVLKPLGDGVAFENIPFQQDIIELSMPPTHVSVQSCTALYAVKALEYLIIFLPITQLFDSFLT